MKRALSLVLSLALCAGLVIPALAAGETRYVTRTMLDPETGPFQMNFYEITNVTSVEEYTYPPIQYMDETVNPVFHVDGSTTVTALATADFGDESGFIVLPVWRDDEGIFWFSYDGDVDFPYPDGQLPFPFGDWERKVIPEGTTQQLTQGMYFFHINQRLDHGFYVIVGDGQGAPGTTPDPAPTAESPSDWAADAVTTAVAAGLVPEALQAKYTQATTRAEFCALAAALFDAVADKEVTPTDVSFTDTEDANVLKMAGLGVVNGVGEGRFDPDAKLTREQAATMLARLAEAVGKPLAAQVPTFADNALLSDWAFDAVGQMQKSGVMGGVGENTFSPATDYTREQSIVTMVRLFELLK